jgi:hypothetical protein
MFAGRAARCNVLCSALPSKPAVAARQLVIPRAAAVAESTTSANGSFGVFTLNYETDNVRRCPRPGRAAGRAAAALPPRPPPTLP